MELNSYQSTKDQVVVGEQNSDSASANSSLFKDAMNAMQDKKILCDKFGCQPSLPPFVIETKPRDTCVERANGEIACGTEISPDKIGEGKGKPDFVNPDSVKPDFVKPEFVKPESGKPDFVKPVPEKPGIGDEWEGDSKGKPKNPTKNPEECRDVAYLLSNPPIAVCLDNLSGGTEKDGIGTQKDRTKTLPSGKGFTKLPGLVLE
ncbi:MAG: hypothetical protein LCH63_20890 [Candidatus Melainabacteria bacterium]|nr:hypothetical protein [Candidatus Melainabacteria bacterium]